MVEVLRQMTRAPANMIGGILIGIMLILAACYIADAIYPERSVLERMLAEAPK